MRPLSNFGNDITNSNSDQNNENEVRNRITQRLTQNGATLMVPSIAGRGIIRVVGRCEDAKENSNLDLSECQLIHVPDAVYHLMRNTELKTCDLSSNVITKIPPKFAVKFSLITELNLSHNKMAKLPDELADLLSLQILNISHNSFISLPTVVFKMQKLKELRANNNQIIEVDSDEIIASDSLETVDLRENPLTLMCYNFLKNLRSQLPYEILVSEREKEDWENI